MTETDSSIQLVVGAGKVDRIIPDAAFWLKDYRLNDRWIYVDYQPTTPTDRIVPEDLAVTLALNSQAGYMAFESLVQHCPISLDCLPEKALQDTSVEERGIIADLIMSMVHYPGFGASVATKLLHKKRPALIPVLDNLAIFTAYMNPRWPEKPARGDSVKDREKILEGLNWIAYDITRPENEAAWEGLKEIEPHWSRIELFDSIWWRWFRSIQPV